MQALEKGDLAKAEKLMQAHIGSVQAALKLQAGGGDPLSHLRSALSPLDAQPLKTVPPKDSPRVRKAGRASANPPEDSSTYLGALL